jgi:hypothetical protein
VGGVPFEKERRTEMGSRRRALSPYSSNGEPRSADVAITVVTALILLVVLVVVSVL